MWCRYNMRTVIRAVPDGIQGIEIIIIFLKLLFVAKFLFAIFAIESKNRIFNGQASVLLSR